MRLDPDHELSPQAIAALRELLHDPEPSKDELAEERLESFVLGTASEASRRETVRALVASHPLRLRLLRLQAEMSRAGAFGLAEGGESPLADVLAHGVGHALGLNASADAWNIDPQWTRFDEKAPSTLRATLEAIGRNLAAFLATPRYATLRRGTSTQGTGSGAKAYAEIDDEGTLVVDVVFGPSVPLDSRQARLDLLDPAGGFVRLATAEVEKRIARFVLDGFGSMVGLDAGSLPGDLFQIVLERDEPPTPRPGFMLAEDGEDVAVLTVTRPPVWAESVLSLSIMAPPALRTRPAGSLEIYVRAGSVDVVLFSCPLSEFGEDEKAIQVPTEGRNGSRTVCGSLLRARVLPTDPPENR